MKVVNCFLIVQMTPQSSLSLQQGCSSLRPMSFPVEVNKAPDLESEKRPKEILGAPRELFVLIETTSAGCLATICCPCLKGSLKEDTLCHARSMSHHVLTYCNLTVTFINQLMQWGYGVLLPIRRSFLHCGCWFMELVLILLSRLLASRTRQF